MKADFALSNFLDVPRISSMLWPWGRGYSLVKRNRNCERKNPRATACTGYAERVLFTREWEGKGQVTPVYSSCDYALAMGEGGHHVTPDSPRTRHTYWLRSAQGYAIRIT